MRSASDSQDPPDGRATYERLADEIRAAILSGQRRPGDRLPSEADLAAQLGVGRSSAREALRVLASEGLVVTLRGVTGGTFISHPEPQLISERLEAALVLLSATEKVTVEDLLATREALELPAVRAATLRADPECLLALAAAIPGRNSAEAEGLGFDTNRDFHELIFAACGNSLLAATARPIFTVLRHRFLRDAAPRGFWGRVARDHRRILTAMEAGDADGASEHMADHLRGLRATYVRIDTARSRPGRSQEDRS